MDNKNLPEDMNERNEGAGRPENNVDLSELMRMYLPDFSDESGGKQTEESENAASELLEISKELSPDDAYDSDEYGADDVNSGDDCDPEDGAQDIVLPDAADDMYDDEEFEADEAYVTNAVESDDGAHSGGKVGYDGDSVDSVDSVESVDSYVSADDSFAIGADDTAIGADDTAIAEDSTDGADDADGEAGETNFDTNTELDATDINLMVAFGLDDELAKTMGADVAAKLAEEIDAEAKERQEREIVRRSVSNEYVDESQAASVAASLKRRCGRLKIKLFLSIVLTLVLILYENLSMFGLKFGGALAFSEYPVIYVMMSLQIMLLCAAVGYEQLLGGAADIFRGRINPCSAAFVVNAAAVVYSAILAEFADPAVEPTLLCACAASSTVFAILYDYFAAKRDILSFNIVSSKRSKYAVRLMSGNEAGIPDELFADDEAAESGVLRIEKTKFADDFFARTGARSKTGKEYSAAYVLISAVLAAIMGIYVALTGENGGVSAAGAAMTTFFATMPLSLFIAMGYPFYKGVSNAYDYDGTILGEASAEDYSEAGAVCFDDSDAFPSYGVKVQNIKIYNNHRIDRVLFYAASAFKAAGGPLSDVFEVATMEIGTSENVTVEEAEEGYLSTVVDDKSIVFGRADALRKHGINLPDAVTGEDDDLSYEDCPMYMIREGRLMAKLIVRYMLDSDFEFLMKELSEEGMFACIKTFDPNIDDEMMKARLGGGNYPFKVLRYADTFEVCRINDRLSSGIVSRGSTRSLLDIIGSCSDVLGMRRAGFIVGVISSVIAAAVAWLLLKSGSFGFITSFAVVVYQLLWSLPVIFTTRMFLK